MKEEQWHHFLNHVVEPHYVEMLLKLDSYYQKHKASLVTAFVHSFHTFCQRLKEEQIKKENMKYVMYSMLRTEISRGRHRYLVEAMDERWYGDNNPIQGYYDASWAFRFLDEWEYQVEEGSRPYMGALKMNVRQMKLMLARQIHPYIVSLIRTVMPEAVQLEAYQILAKEINVEVRVGEYWDWNEMVYKDMQAERDEQAMKEWLREKDELAYHYGRFTDVDLSAGDYTGLDFRFADFKRSVLEASCFRGATLVGTVWKNSRLEHTDFSRSVLHGADFYESDLRGAVFQEAVGNTSLGLLAWSLPLSEQVNFVKANLQGANFSNAQFRGALFVGAHLAHVNFKGADLTGAFFSKTDHEHVQLDEQQRKSIRWMEMSLS